MTTYPLTLSTLREHARKLLLTNAAVKDHWTDADWTVLLNEAQNDVFLELLATFREEYFVEVDDGLTTSSSEFDLRSLKRPYQRMLLLERMTGAGTWEEVPVLPVGNVRRYQTRTPGVECWYVVGSKIKTEYNVSANTYRITYHYKVPDLTSENDIPEIPPEYQEMLAYRAAYIACMQVGDMGRMETMKNEYDQRVERMRHTAKLKTLNQRRLIQDVEGYDLDDLGGFRYIYPTSA